MLHVALHRCLLPIICLFLISTCVPLFAKDYVVSLKHPTDFYSVQTSGHFQITVAKGDRSDVKVYGEKKDLERIRMYVKDNTLIIKMKDISDWHRDDVLHYRVNLVMPEMRKLTLNGSSILTTNNSFEGGRLDCQINGSGSLILNAIQYREVFAQINGAGTMKMVGTAKKLEMKIAGSGEFTGDQLRTENADVSIAGSGQISISASQKLNCTIAGSGSISYIGNPQITQTISGSGSIRPLPNQ